MSHVINYPCLIGETISFRKDGSVCCVCQKDAVFRLVVEADQFGGEAEDYCAVHFHEAKTNLEDRQTLETCEYCNSTLDVCLTKDPEEGFSAKPRNLCIKCRAAITSEFDCENSEDIEDD